MIKPVLIMIDCYCELLTFAAKYGFAIMQHYFSSMSLIPLALKIFIAATISGAGYFLFTHLFNLSETKLLLQRMKLTK